ncbi:sce7726 family protein [Aureimonas phyllosphaerae]|uniref:Sce7726 family protein n=1 Tax=Aureimonas phyllosphaerae TaxID=1166078 RepID=A0A7W6BXI6_9HYPH|nr:sce7726 family protein [Aureimonas phyllosphaerae]MBB3938240.1 hypothetical protein [Aureimonas phyllosphaerae]MBB3962247.1 hypothetical protein [Aureimonas phyllosphaerae]
MIAGYSAEHEAVASLLQFLRRGGALRAADAIILELAVGKYANRVDVAVVDGQLHTYEIKTESDDLSRLRSQIAAYASISDMVSIAVATKHLPSAISSVPDFVGVLELQRSDDGLNIRQVREPVPSPVWSASAALSLLPVTEIRRLLPKNSGLLRRENVVAEALSLPDDEIRRASLDFMRHRYKGTTYEFAASTKGRAIGPNDLNMLRLWKRLRLADAKVVALKRNDNSSDSERSTFEFVGRSFGPIPEEIKRRIQS